MCKRQGETIYKTHLQNWNEFNSELNECFLICNAKTVCNKIFIALGHRVNTRNNLIFRKQILYSSFIRIVIRSGAGLKEIQNDSLTFQHILSRNLFEEYVKSDEAYY